MAGPPSLPHPPPVAAPPSLTPPQTQDQDRIDVGWVSVWVKTTAQGITGMLYCWTLVAPAVFPGTWEELWGLRCDEV